MVALVTDPAWHRHLQQIGPASAGLSIQATVRLSEPPIGTLVGARRTGPVGGRGAAAGVPHWPYGTPEPDPVPPPPADPVARDCRTAGVRSRNDFSCLDRPAMRRIVLMMSVSLDGFIEGPNHEIDWHLVDDELHRHFNTCSAGWARFLDGRVTYELMAGYWPTADADPDAARTDAEFARIWRDMPKIVYSRTLRARRLEHHGRPGGRRRRGRRS